MSMLLNLKGQGLSEFPRLLLQHTQITNLNLEDNQITTIPDWIQELTNLKVLYLSRNLIENIQPLTKLTALEVLHLNHNRIAHIPEDFAHLKFLKRLFVNNNLLSRLPGTLGQLINLKFLLAAENKLEAIDDDIFLLPDLETLNLFQNRLTCLSARVRQLKKLNYLQLSMNRIDRLPDGMWENPAITTLSVFSNDLTHIPRSFMELTGLESLNLADNHLTRIEYIPASVRQLSIYANPVKFIDHRILDSFCNRLPGTYDYLYVDSQQADDLKIQRSSFGASLKIIDIPSGTIPRLDFKSMPQPLIDKWGLTRQKHPG